MKRIFAMILAVLTLVALTSCTGGDKPTPTAEAQQTAAGGTAQPGSTAEATPRQTLDPARQAYDPYTDYDNRCASLIERTIVDTEEAYYLYANGYIMYYDKISEDSGFLCPRPECVHDEKFNNRDCPACADMAMPSFAYYEGRLWWVGYPDQRHFGIYRMELDGTNKELLHTFDIEGRFQSMMLWYFHRGRLFWSSLKQELTDGEPYNTAAFGYMSLDDFEPHDLCERRSFFTPQPTMRFAGDSVYMFVNYDGIGPGDGEIPDPEYDEAGFIEWRKTVRMTDEILRWDPSLEEPETVYLNSDKSCLSSFNNAYVSQEGEIYFVEDELDDPDKEWDQYENPYVFYINRVGADGKAERIIELTAEDGTHYCMLNMSGGVILAMDVVWENKENVIRGVWLLTFDGETLYRGELPMQYREKYGNRERTDDTGQRIIVKHKLSDYHACWATRDEILFCFRETYHNDSATHGDSAFYDFVKYKVTPDGLIEIPLAECRAHYADEGW